MAINTKEKRFSMLSTASPLAWQLLFEADGTVDADDRLHLLHLYSGVEADDLDLQDDMTTVIADLIPFVRVEIPDIPEIVAQQYLIRGAREFCRLSRAWTRDIVLSWTRNQSDYDLLTAPEEGATSTTTVGLQNVEIVGVISQRLEDGSEIIPTTPAQLNEDFATWRHENGTPKRFYMQEDNSSITVVYRPTVTDTRAVTGVSLPSASNVVITLTPETIDGVSSHFYAAGDIVTFYAIGVVVELNGSRFLIKAVTSTTITLSNLDGTDTDGDNFTGAFSASGADVCNRDSAHFEVAVQPNIGSTSLPQILTQRYEEALISGALMFLFASPSKAWTSGALFSYHKSNFLQEVDRAKSEAQDRYLKRVPRSVKYGGVGGATTRKSRYGSR